MKNVLIFLFLLIFSLSCFASNWEQIGEKDWIDLSSWSQNGNIRSAWVKSLNPGDWDLRNNKKIFYKLIYYHADCRKRQLGATNVVVYDLKGNVIDNINFDLKFVEYAMEPVIPDSVGESLYDVLCSLK